MKRRTACHPAHRRAGARAVAVLATCLALPANAAPVTAIVCDAVWRDAPRGRDLPVRIRLPAGDGRVPLVLFSPGLGGSITGGRLWAEAWVRRGIAVVHLEHPGSDARVYRAPGTPEERRARVRAAASAEQLQARIADAGFVLDTLATRQREGACDLGRIDRTRIGFAGHSMGAWTTQGLAGQRFAGGRQFTDRRIKAAIALSPSALVTTDLAASFAPITIPFLSITGTADGAAATDKPERRQAAAAQRTGPFSGMTGAGKYLIVFDAGDHMVFAGNGARAPAALNAHIEAATIAATTAFWGATLLGSAADRSFLDGGGLAAALAASDRYEHK